MPSLKPLRYILTPAGAAVAAICFFLPWVEVSCGPVNVHASGARIGGTLWISFAAMLAVLVSFLYFILKCKHLMLYCRWIAIFLSLGALATLICKLVVTVSHSPVKPTLSQIISMIQPPFYGELIGLILAFVGAFVLPVGYKQKKRKIPPPESKDHESSSTA